MSKLCTLVSNVLICCDVKVSGCRVDDDCDWEESEGERARLLMEGEQQLQHQQSQLSLGPARSSGEGEEDTEDLASKLLNRETCV